MNLTEARKIEKELAKQKQKGGTIVSSAYIIDNTITVVIEEIKVYIDDDSDLYNVMKTVIKVTSNVDHLKFENFTLFEHANKVISQFSTGAFIIKFKLSGNLDADNTISVNKEQFLAALDIEKRRSANNIVLTKEVFAINFMPFITKPNQTQMDKANDYLAYKEEESKKKGTKTYVGWINDLTFSDDFKQLLKVHILHETFTLTLPFQYKYFSENKSTTDEYIQKIVLRYAILIHQNIFPLLLEARQYSIVKKYSNRRRKTDESENIPIEEEKQTRVKLINAMINKLLDADNARALARGISKSKELHPYSTDINENKHYKTFRTWEEETLSFINMMLGSKLELDEKMKKECEDAVERSRSYEAKYHGYHPDASGGYKNGRQARGSGHGSMQGARERPYTPPIDL